MRSYSRTALLLTFVFLTVGGLATGRWELVAAIIPVVTVIFLETQYRFPTRLQLSAVLIIEQPEVMEGEKVDLKVDLQNQGPDLMAAEVRLELPEGLRLVEGHLTLPVNVRSGEHVRMGWKVIVEDKGHFTPGPLFVRVNDAFHLYERSLRIPLSGSIRSSPHIENLTKVGLRPSMLRPYSGNMRSGLAGPGTEFYCLRDYRPGDQLRQINWKASARKGSIISNETENERIGDLIVLLDLQKVEGRLKDRSIQAAASLCAFWLKERNRVGMIVLGEHVDKVSMGTGRRQQYRITERLMDIKSGTRPAPLSAEKVWKRYFPAKALVVVITTLMEKTMPSTVKRLVRQGASVVVLCPFEESTGGDRVEGLADKLVKMRKDDLLFDLMDFCRVVEWEVGTPISRCFLEVRNW